MISEFLLSSLPCSFAMKSSLLVVGGVGGVGGFGGGGAVVVGAGAGVGVVVVVAAPGLLQLEYE